MRKIQPTIISSDWHRETAGDVSAVLSGADVKEVLRTQALRKSSLCQQQSAGVPFVAIRDLQRLAGYILQFVQKMWRRILG